MNSLGPAVAEGVTSVLMTEYAFAYLGMDNLANTIGWCHDIAFISSETVAD